MPFNPRQLKANTAPFYTWSGYAFENVCLKHIAQIRHALNLDYISSETGSFKSHGNSVTKEGVQIDLLFDRQDQVITLCEIKYSTQPFVLDKAYAKELLRKIEVFTTLTRTKKQIFLALLTAQKMKKNIWSEDLIAQEVSLDDLFQF